MYGGSQTTGEYAESLRRAGEGQPCPSCGDLQISGTRTAPSPEHEPALVKHYYERGGWRMTDAERRAYAASQRAFNGSICHRCQTSQGGTLANYAKMQKRELNLE